MNTGFSRPRRLLLLLVYALAGAAGAGMQGCAVRSEQPLIPVHVNTVPIPAEGHSAPAPEKPKAVQVGKASWYGPGFHGKVTASGAVFDQHDHTAAHRSFPLGSKARVTRLDNEKSVEVEINDRGPFVDGRVIDLSRAAAEALGMIEEGVVVVRVELLAEAERREAAGP